MKRIIVQLLLLILPIILWGQVDSLLIEKRVVSMVDSSHSDNMVLIQTFEVNVPVEKVWEAYTTKKGWESWAVAQAKIDFKVNGLIQTSYDKNTEIGDSNTIRLHIINFVPKKLLTLQAELSPHFPAFMKEDAKDLFNLVHFESITPTKTKIISYGIGYKKNKKYLDLMKFFISGNEASYLQLIAYLENGEVVKY